MTEIQNMVEAHYRVTSILNGIVDAQDGRILAAAGWQDICVKFHRVNPSTRARCTESDLSISGHLKQGKTFAYKCRNGLWDIGTPIMVKGQHIATVFMGQFFYEGEEKNTASLKNRPLSSGLPRTPIWMPCPEYLFLALNR